MDQCLSFRRMSFHSSLERDRSLTDLPPRISLRPNPALLFYHFFRVAFYSIYLLFTLPRFPRSRDPSSPPSKARKPPVADYPALTVQSFKVFWTACVVFLPVLWKEGQM